MIKVATISTVVAFAVLATQGVGQNARKGAVIEEKSMSVTNPCLVKGGLGIINPNLYIDVTSAKNELLFGTNETWSGLDFSESEVVFFFAGRVWATHALPKDFDLSRAVVVSFERGNVRFFDFQKMGGCYYKRMAK